MLWELTVDCLCVDCVWNAAQYPPLLYPSSLRRKHVPCPDTGPESSDRQLDKLGADTVLTGPVIPAPGPSFPRKRESILLILAS